MSNERERLAAMLEEWAEARDEDARLSDPLGKLRDETIRIARDLRRAAALLREPREAPVAHCECCDGPVQASCPEGFGVPCSPVVPREAPAAEPERIDGFVSSSFVSVDGFPYREFIPGELLPTAYAEDFKPATLIVRRPERDAGEAP